MWVHGCLQGPRVYKLGLVMGQHIDIIWQYIGDTDIIARSRVQQLRVAVLLGIHRGLVLLEHCSVFIKTNAVGK